MQSAIKVYRHGLAGGVACSSGPGEQAAKRGECSGWSVRSSKGNTRFLWSVIQDELTGIGVSASLTVKLCPESHADWAKARRSLIKRLERMGLIRLHWITEMQKRGYPHMHVMAYFDPEACPREWRDLAPQYFCKMVESHWTAVASQWGSARWGQDSKPIFDPVGWLNYLAKHAARGAGHYQRCQETLPAAWQGVTGRMWGHVGDWPVQEPVGLELDWLGWFALRRMFRSYRVAKARSLPPEKRGRSLRAARRCLTYHAPIDLLEGGRSLAPGRTRGISGWIPERVTLRMVEHLTKVGYSVESV